MSPTDDTPTFINTTLKISYIAHSAADVANYHNFIAALQTIINHSPYQTTSLRVHDIDHLGNLRLQKGDS